MHIFILLISLMAVHTVWHTGPARQLLVGQYRYDIGLQTEYAHDDDADNTYFIVRRANSHLVQCSAFRRIVTRRGALKRTGMYAVSGSQLLFKERRVGPRQTHQTGNERWAEPDSTVKTFSPDQTGRLQLIEVRDYTGGKSQERSYGIKRVQENGRPAEH